MTVHWAIEAAAADKDAGASAPPVDPDGLAGLLGTPPTLGTMPKPMAADPAGPPPLPLGSNSSS